MASLFAVGPRTAGVAGVASVAGPVTAPSPALTSEPASTPPPASAPAVSPPALEPPPTCSRPRGGEPLTVSPVLLPPPAAALNPSTAASPDYRHRLRSTPFGWPVQTTWCVWVQPLEPGEGPNPVAARWQEAVSRALEEWRTLLPIAIVPNPEWAQVTIWRRRPPPGVDAAGRRRASHGRSILSLQGVRGNPPTGIEPRVIVLISPDQRKEALQATALHELGHAFGLWGHSDQPDDALAESPGPQPILRLSSRDRATVRWLYAQPTPLRSDP